MTSDATIKWEGQQGSWVSMQKVWMISKASNRFEIHTHTKIYICKCFCFKMIKKFEGK